MSILLTLAFWRDVWQALATNVRLILILAAIGAVILTVIGIRSCVINQRIQQTQEDIDQGRRTIDDAKIEVEIVPVEKQRNEISNAEKNTNVSLNAVNRARNADSSGSNANVRTVTERFCRAFPDDSRCKSR